MKLLSTIKENCHSGRPNQMQQYSAAKKLANAIEKSFARHQLDQNCMNLLKVEHSKAKRRLNTKSDILKRPGKKGEIA